jgi:hypothetical protein
VQAHQFEIEELMPSLQTYKQMLTNSLQNSADTQEEQEVLKHIWALREKGLGARKIATQIQNSHPGYEDFPYHKVHRILKRKFQGLHD